MDRWNQSHCLLALWLFIYYLLHFWIRDDNVTIRNPEMTLAPGSEHAGAQWVNGKVIWIGGGVTDKHPLWMPNSCPIPCAFKPRLCLTNWATCQHVRSSEKSRTRARRAKKNSIWNLSFIGWPHPADPIPFITSSVDGKAAGPAGDLLCTQFLDVLQNISSMPCLNVSSFLFHVSHWAFLTDTQRGNVVLK